MRTLQHRTQLCAGLLAAIIVVGTVAFMLTEGLSAPDAAYLAMVTMTTVGYGDITPRTPAGRLAAVLFILAGVGTFMTLVASATEDLLNRRDRRARVQKSHMLAGLFFSEIGTDVLRLLDRFTTTAPAVPAELAGADAWSREDLEAVARALAAWDVAMDARQGNLEELRSLLQPKTDLLVRLLENPVLLERGSFTELLRALFHLREELAHRADLLDLPPADYSHLSGDLERVHTHIVPEWIAYMRYQQAHYPYLYSLAVRTNPFTERSTAAVQ